MSGMDFSFSFKKRPDNIPAPQIDVVDEQMTKLRACGVNAKAHITSRDISQGQDNSAFESPPFAQVLRVMGGTDAEGSDYSDDVYLLSAVAINGEGDYTRTIEQLKRIAKDRLPLEDISDSFDAESLMYTIRATLDGEPKEWMVMAMDASFDSGVLSELAMIVLERGSGAQFCATTFDDGWRAIVCATDEELNDLREMTELSWETL